MTWLVIVKVLKAAGSWVVKNWQIVLMAIGAVMVLALYASWRERGDTIAEMQTCIARRDAIIAEQQMVNESWVQQARRWAEALERYQSEAEQYERDLDAERERRRRTESALADAEERIASIEQEVTSEDCDEAVRELSKALGWAP